MVKEKDKPFPRSILDRPGAKKTYCNYVMSSFCGTFFLCEAQSDKNLNITFAELDWALETCFPSTF